MEGYSAINLSKTPLLSQTILLKDPKAWNSIIQYHAKLKNDRAILESFTQMEALGCPANNVTLPLVLKACSRLQAIKRGKKIHSDILNTPLIEDVRVQTALVDFYSKCGFADHARDVFDEMGARDLVSWNAMISGYAANGRYEDAIALFLRLGEENLEPNSGTVVSLLSACAEMMELRLGQELHCYCLRNGLFDLNFHVGTSLIGFYSRFDVMLSRFIFDSMVLRNVVAWNAMILGYFKAGNATEALNLFIQMLIVGTALCSVTIIVVVQSCADLGCIEVCKQVHQLAVKFGFTSDSFVENALIDMYAEAGSLESSRKLFGKMCMQDVASWNAMMHAYRSFGYYEEAISLFNRMQLEEIRGDMVTLAIMLSICAQCCSLREGNCLHAYMIKSGEEMDISVGNVLLSMYVDFSCVESALKIFYKMHRLDVVSYNMLLAVLISSRLIIQAWEIFGQMCQVGIRPNSFTLVSILPACGTEASLNTGRSIHGYAMRNGIEFNSSLCTALTDMYMNCGDEKTARWLFERFSDRDLVSWNAMISCYAQNSQPSEALLLFQQMQLEVKPNLVTMANVLQSCGHLANLLQGRCIHGHIVRRFASYLDVGIGNALLTMYAKCGNIHQAEKVFRSLPKRDVISYNAMIAGYGMHGYGKHALLIFSEMQEAGFRPTDVTFISVLSACSHSGLTVKGWKHFHSMSQDYNITPQVIHYACVADLLSRAGLLDEAWNFIYAMPVEPDACVWRALLGGCWKFSNIKLAQMVSEKLLELEPMNIGNYILLSNIYAAAGNWDDVNNLRIQIIELGLQKDPGCSWIVIKNQVHRFMAGDRSHIQTDEIYSKLSCLTACIMEAGYVPDLSTVSHDLED